MSVGLHHARITFLQNKFKCKIGYSGHESGLAVSFAAAGYNISSLERHVTLDRAMYGSDQAASIEAHALKNFSDAVRNIPVIMGSGEKKISPAEMVIREKLRGVVTDS